MDDEKKAKLKDAARRWGPAIVGVGVGILIPVALGWKKPKPVVGWVRKDDLQWMADNPGAMMRQPESGALIISDHSQT